MIIEVRTYQLRPGTLAEAEKRFAAALPVREKHSKLAAFWHTEVGALNQIIHVWTYDSFAQRTAVRAAAAKEEGWPPPIREKRSARFSAACLRLTFWTLELPADSSATATPSSNLTPRVFVPPMSRPMMTPARGPGADAAPPAWWFPGNAVWGCSLSVTHPAY